MKQRFPFNDRDHQALKCLRMLNPGVIIDPKMKKNIPSIADMLYFFLSL